MAAPQPAPSPAAPKEAPLPKPAAAPEQEKRAAPPPAASVQPAPSAKAEPAPAAPSPVQEPKKAQPVSEPLEVVPPASEQPAPAVREPIASGAAEAVNARPPRAAPVQPVELPSEPTGEMQVASHLELMDWRQSETAEAGSGAEPTSSWTRRAIEVDFDSQEASPSEAGASEVEGEVPLASVHEFIPTWDPSTEPVASATEPGAPPETSTEWQAAAASTPEGTSSGEAQNTQLVQLQEALEALRQATTRAELGKVLLSYAQGRFPRGFLLGETFGFARVGHAYGPGSDKPEVSALQVDLEAPTLLAMAAAGGRLIVSSVPESQEDEALFAALGESFSHLMAAPIRLQQRTVGFVVIDGGPSPFGPEELDELELLITAASEAYGRLTDSSLS
ncbi:MAG: hypothetical protein ACXU86_05670 [Archangium sp.]